MKALRRVLLIISAITLTACSPLSPVKLPAVKTYNLHGVSKQRVTRHGRPLTLLVSQPVASAGYQTEQMIYIEKPYQLQAFASNSWIASPANMLKPLIAESLRNSGLYHSVVTTPFAGLTDRRLDVRVLYFYQDFIQSPSRVRVALQLNFINSKTSRVMASKRINAVVIAKQRTPYGGVLAANQATRILMQKIVRFVRYLK